VEDVLKEGAYSRVSREIGTAPDGDVLIAAFGKFGAYVQKGDGEKKQYASLQKGQLIENITVEEALKLFELPRTVGTLEDVDIVVTKGKFGPYIKYGDRNVRLPKGADPLKISLDECTALINAAPVDKKAPVKEWGELKIMRGAYGPYIKCNGQNYKLPKGVDAEALTEAEARAIMEKGKPTSAKSRRYFKKK